MAKNKPFSHDSYCNQQWIALPKDGEQIHARQIKKGVKKKEKHYYSKQQIGSIIRATVKHKASSELTQQ